MAKAYASPRDLIGQEGTQLGATDWLWVPVKPKKSQDDEQKPIDWRSVLYLGEADPTAKPVERSVANRDFADVTQSLK